VTYPATTITGSVEGTYSRILSKPHIDTPIPLRAYDSSNGFALNTAHFGLKHQLNEHVYAQIHLDAGADAAYNHNPGLTPNSSPLELFDVREAYAVYTDSGFTFTAGKFTTYEGIEVVDGPANPTISRGFLYWLAEPITHVGAKLHYATGPIDIGVGVVNGWDTNNGVFMTGDNNDQKTFIWRAAITPVPQFFAALSGTYGVEKPTLNGGNPRPNDDPRLSVDLTGAVTPDPMIAINYQINFGNEKHSDFQDPTKTASWFGFGLQPVFKMDAFSAGLRFEFFQDKGLSRTAAANVQPAPTIPPTTDKLTVWNVSIAPGYTWGGGVTTRVEYRHDAADQPALWQSKKGQDTLAIGVSYVF
jgi:hypothetical protein